MKRVQDALSSLGIPVFAGAWKATAEGVTPPPQYLVYTTQTYEDEHWDDANRRYRVYIYLNLLPRIIRFGIRFILMRCTFFKLRLYPLIHNTNKAGIGSCITAFAQRIP